MSARADELAGRIRPILGAAPGISERRMFGGVAFMLDGNMIAAAMGDGELLARVDRAIFEAALARPGARPMIMGERRMTGFLAVDGDGIESDDDLAGWIDLCLDYVKTLPPKQAKKPARKSARRAAG